MCIILFCWPSHKYPKLCLYHFWLIWSKGDAHYCNEAQVKLFTFLSYKWSTVTLGIFNITCGQFHWGLPGSGTSFIGTLPYSCFKICNHKRLKYYFSVKVSIFVVNKTRDRIFGISNLHLNHFLENTIRNIWKFNMFRIHSSFVWQASAECLACSSNWVCCWKMSTTYLCLCGAID